MITHIHLKHFKCFSELNLPLGKLTLLTGKNATGKSSIIQSLLLLHQNLESHKETNKLALNGESIDLGSFSDVLDSRSGRKSFSIGVTTDQCKLIWRFESADRAALTANLTSIQGSKDWKTQPDHSVSFFSAETNSPIIEEAQQLSNNLRSLLHVSTERIGPRETYQADPETDTRLGARGEYTAWFIHRNSENPVSESLLIPDAPPLLQRQTESWLKHFFPGAAFQVERIKNTNLVTLRFRTSSKDDFHRPNNVGYGLSHLLPVIVGGLGVKKNQLFIVENPEAHLHPSAQAEIGSFLAKVAASGAQVILESHSDHVLNGIRLAVKNQTLSPEEVQIHYFNHRDTPPQLVTPSISSNGALDNWPQGFFDQFDKDLDQLTTW